MTCRLVSRQACEDPRKLFNTWLNCLQVKWQWNSQAVNFLYRSRCWECDRPGIKFCQSLLGIFYWGCPMSVSIYGVLSYSLYPCDWVLSIKSSVSISIHIFTCQGNISMLATSVRHYVVILLAFIQVAWQTESIHVSVRKDLHCSAHLLVMAMDYCIVFCLWSTLIAFLLLWALCNVIYSQRFRHLFSWAVFFKLYEAFSQL